jgi:transcriptional regulator with XRE-family HTH domain
MPWKATGGLVLTRNSSELDIGARLAAIRAQRGQSQGTTSRLAGLAPAYLSRIETGHVHPTFATVMRVLDALHAGLDELRAPDEVRPRGHPSCPISGHGHCLLELLRTDLPGTPMDGNGPVSPVMHR